MTKYQFKSRAYKKSSYSCHLRLKRNNLFYCFKTSQWRRSAANGVNINSLTHYIFSYFQIHETDCLPEMICDSCIVQLNVAYNFKKRAIESDSKLRQYIIEKGIGPIDNFGVDDNGYSMAITDGQRGSSVSTYLNAAHSLCDFVVPEPLRQLHPDTSVLAQEYLRNFETPQSMNSNIAQPKAASSSCEPFRCMPIQIKVEYAEENGNQPSPIGSEENLRTVSDTSSIQSAANRRNNISKSINLSKQPYDHLAHCSDEEFVNHYLRPPSNQKHDLHKSDSDKSPASSKSTGTSKSSTTLHTTISNKTNASTVSKNTIVSEKESTKNLVENNEAVANEIRSNETKESSIASGDAKRKRADDCSDTLKQNDRRSLKVARRELLLLNQNEILETSRNRTSTMITGDTHPAKTTKVEAPREGPQSSNKSKNKVNINSEKKRVKPTNEKNTESSTKKPANEKKSATKKHLHKLKIKNRTPPATTSHAKVTLQADGKQHHKKNNRKRS